jgi:hypothetical protein
VVGIHAAIGFSPTAGCVFFQNEEYQMSKKKAAAEAPKEKSASKGYECPVQFGAYAFREDGFGVVVRDQAHWDDLSKDGSKWADKPFTETHPQKKEGGFI